MNTQKYLLIIKGEDKTEEIYSFESEKQYININYKGNEKIYKYSRNDFEFYKDPIEIDTQKYKILLNQGYTYNIVKIIKFDNYYRIFFSNNTSKVISENNIQLLKNDDIKTVSINKFDYFKDISKIVSVKTEEGSSLLTNEYEKINFISRDTALYKYLNAQEGPNNIYNNLDKIIFPFGANESQFEAVKNAMKSQISIIEGPPRNRKDTNDTKYYCKYCKKWTNGGSGI